jgi:hypothetical protein
MIGLRDDRTDVHLDTSNAMVRPHHRRRERLRNHWGKDTGSSPSARPIE